MTNKRKRGGTKRTTRRTPTKRAGSKNPTFDEDMGGVTEGATVDIPDDSDNVKSQKNMLVKIAGDTESVGLLNGFLDHLEKNNIDALRKEYAELKAFVPPDTTATAFEANKPKNRYSDQICFDHTRVKLFYNVPPEGDYIHANWTNFEELGHPIICTQGPLPDTVNDFWRMVYQEKCYGVVMLCKRVELGKQKCAQYYPPAPGESMAYGTLMVKNVKTQSIDRSYDVVFLELGKNGLPFVSELNIRLYLWRDWPDKFVPQTGMGVVRMVRAIRVGAKGKPDNTVVVHCSAGVGRTGTVVALSVVMSKILEKKPFVVYDIVKELRTKRYNAVQTETQYIYIHRVICDYIQAKGMRRPIIDQFYSDYNAYIKELQVPKE